MANRNFSSGGKLYSMHSMPVLVDCSFSVDATNANGITNLKGPLIQAVYMHSTHATPSAINPDAGNIVIQLQDNFNSVLGANSVVQAALSGTPLTSVTDGVAYVITSLGTASAAQWQAKGLPSGITAAVGVSFIATATGSIGGSAEVQAPASTGSGISAIEILGDPSSMSAPNPASTQGFGASVILQCRDYAGALANPADGSVVKVQLLMSNSSVTVGTRGQ